MLSAPGKSFKTSNNHSNSPYGFTLKRRLVKSKPYGFTLIELLVVIAIIGILTGGAIVAYNNFSQVQTVRRAAATLKSDIRETQNRAVSGLKHIDCKNDNYDMRNPLTSGPDNIEDYQLDGHYVIFDTTDATTRTYFQRQQSCSAATDSDQFPTTTPIVRPDPDPEKIDFPATVGISSLSVVGCTFLGPGNQLTINFKPLGGVDFYEGVNLSGTELTSCTAAQIDITDGTNNYRVEVDKSGKITESELP